MGCAFQPTDGLLSVPALERVASEPRAGPSLTVEILTIKELERLLELSLSNLELVLLDLTSPPCGRPWLACA